MSDEITNATSDPTFGTTGTVKTLEELGILNTNITEAPEITHNQADGIVVTRDGEFARVNPNNLVSTTSFTEFQNRIEKVLETYITNGTPTTTLEFRVIANELQWRYAGQDQWYIVTGSSSWKGDAGDSGLSAYQLALKNGYVGSEDAWLAGLIGRSAYEIAVKNGFVGTEQQWLESLKGMTVYESVKAHGYGGTEEEFYSLLMNIPTDICIGNDNKIYLSTFGGQLIGTGIEYPQLTPIKQNVGTAFGVFYDLVNKKSIYTDNFYLDQAGDIVFKGAKVEDADGNVSTIGSSDKWNREMTMLFDKDVNGIAKFDGASDITVSMTLNSNKIYTTTSTPNPNMGETGDVVLMINPKYLT